MPGGDGAHTPTSCSRTRGTTLARYLQAHLGESVRSAEAGIAALVPGAADYVHPLTGVWPGVLPAGYGAVSPVRSRVTLAATSRGSDPRPPRRRHRFKAARTAAMLTVPMSAANASSSELS